jgi:hypothetical protein
MSDLPPGRIPLTRSEFQASSSLEPVLSNLGNYPIGCDYNPFSTAQSISDITILEYRPRGSCGKALVGKYAKR